MYLHLGQDTTVRTSEIIGLFDLDTASLSRHTRDYLTGAEQSGRVINVTEELPKSFVVTSPRRNGKPVLRKGTKAGGRPKPAKTEQPGGQVEQTLYISQLATVTLKKRIDSLAGQAVYSGG